MSPRILRIVPMVLAVLLTARLGHAANASAKERRARTACLAGDYTEGVKLLSELFVATMDPTFIFNQGRCFEQNRRYDDAIGRFQEFLRVGRTMGKAERAEAQKHIDDCKALLASERAEAPRGPAIEPAGPPTAGASKAPEPTPTPPGGSGSSVSTVSTTPKTEPTRDQGAALRTAGIVTAWAGVAALAAGIVFNLKVNSLASDLKKTDGYNPDAESDRKTYKTLGWIGYGVGAACVATGVVLYLLGRSTSEGSIAFAPTLEPGQAGFALKGAF
jgi:hypothetical protein